MGDLLLFVAFVLFSFVFPRKSHVKPQNRPSASPKIHKPGRINHLRTKKKSAKIEI